MNTGHKTIVAMLAVVAVLLAVNIVQGPRAAEAQEVGGDGDPYVVKWVSIGASRYARVWSDGQVGDWQKPDGVNCDFELVRVAWPPVDHPFPVIDARGDSIDAMTLEYADGRVDHLGASFHRCILTGDGSAPFCMGDVDRNGETNFNDLLFVLNDWGECE